MQKPHLAALRMTPTHGRLANLETISLGQEKQFGIEAKTKRRLLFKNAPRSLPMKEFEAALGILESQSQKQANHAIEEFRTEFTESRLALFNQAVMQLP